MCVTNFICVNFKYKNRRLIPNIYQGNMKIAHHKWRVYEIIKMTPYNRKVSGTRSITGWCLSVTLLIVDLWQYCAGCIRSGVRCVPMHPHCGALPAPYVPVLVSRRALVTHLYTYAYPRCKTSQYQRTFILLSVSLWNNLADPVFGAVGLAGFKSRANAFLLAQAAQFFFCLLLFSLSLLSVYRMLAGVTHL